MNVIKTATMIPANCYTLNIPKFCSWVTHTCS